MLIPDVNIFVDAFRREGLARDWLEEQRRMRERVGVVTEVAASTVRILTNPRIWATPVSAQSVLVLFAELLKSETFQWVETNYLRWGLFTDLVNRYSLVGNDIPDALLAATVVNAEGVLVTHDTGFARFHNVNTIILRG